MLCNVDPKCGKYHTASVIIRGKTASPSEVAESMGRLRENNMAYFKDWLPDNFKYTICNVPSQGYETSSSFIGFNSAIKELFRKMRGDFSKLFHRRSFLHRYTSEGMDEMEFTEAD